MPRPRASSEPAPETSRLDFVLPSSHRTHTETSVPSSTSMSAMRLHAAGTALSLDSVERPVPRDHEVLLQVLACGVCRYCRDGMENLCEFALFTGYTVDGGYAQFVVADARYCLALPVRYADAE